MIGVLTHHWAKPDKIEEAKTLLDGNGLAQSKAPGFGSRHTLISLSDPTKISTLVTWDSNEIYDAWAGQPGAGGGHGRRGGAVGAAAAVGAVRRGGLRRVNSRGGFETRPYAKGQRGRIGTSEKLRQRTTEEHVSGIRIKL